MEDGDLDLIPLSKRRRQILPTKVLSPRAVPPGSSAVSANQVPNEVLQEWPGLPRGVKFDPSDEDLLWHLLAKVGRGGAMPHPFIDKFVTSLDENDIFGYTHPERLPGVKQDGSPSYFFHKIFKPCGQKYQKIQHGNWGKIFWNKVGNLKPVLVDEVHQGCKMILILYVNMRNGEKFEKTDWVMHQYHVGSGESQEGELVVSKIFYQQRSKPTNKDTQDIPSDSIDVLLSEQKPLVFAELPGSESPIEKQLSDKSCGLKPAQGGTKLFDKQEAPYEFSVHGSGEDAAMLSDTSLTDSSENTVTQCPLIADWTTPVANSCQSNSFLDSLHSKPSESHKQILSCCISVFDVKRHAGEEHAQVNEGSQPQKSLSLNSTVCVKAQPVGEGYVSNVSIPSDLKHESQDHNHKQFDKAFMVGKSLFNEVQRSGNFSYDSQLFDPVRLLIPTKVKHGPSEEDSINGLGSANVETQNSTKNANSQDPILSNFVLNVKSEHDESVLHLPSMGALPCSLDLDVLANEVKTEVAEDHNLDMVDNIPLKDRLKMLHTSLPVIDNCNKERCTLPSGLHIPVFDSVNSVNAKTNRFSLRKKRKKTATDSIVTALEEDAPGLLQVLLDKGITADEIKLYGDHEDGDAIEISSPRDSFEDMETVITKLFSDHPSLLKFPSVRQIRGAQADYCLSCLISLIEQTRYLRFRAIPVEWGWCRDLQSFIFVFEKHNRIVLERPEYGYATYFFELVESLPIDWQIRRLVTAMKLANCSRSSIIENKTLLVGEDLTEGEACVLEEYGWMPNSGLGSMLNYCDRVVHDRKSERFSSEWRSKIVKLLMQGQDGGRTVMTNLPKKALKCIGEQRPETKLEPEKLVEHTSNCYPEIKLES